MKTKEIRRIRHLVGRAFLTQFPGPTPRQSSPRPNSTISLAVKNFRTGVRCPPPDWMGIGKIFCCIDVVKCRRLDPLEQTVHMLIDFECVLPLAFWLQISWHCRSSLHQQCRWESAMFAELVTREQREGWSKLWLNALMTRSRICSNKFRLKYFRDLLLCLYRSLVCSVSHL